MDDRVERLRALTGRLLKATGAGFFVAMVGTFLLVVAFVWAGIPVEILLYAPPAAFQQVLWVLAALLAGYVVAAWVGNGLAERNGRQVVHRAALATGPLAGTVVVLAAGPLLPPGLPSEPSSLLLVFAVVLLAAVVASAVIGAAVMLPLTPRRAPGVATGAALVFGGGLFAGGWPGIVAAVAAVLAWDAGRHGATLAAQLDDDARTTRNELVHAGAGTGVALAGLGVAGLSLLARPLGNLLVRSGYGVAAGVAFAVGALALLALLRE